MREAVKLLKCHHATLYRALTPRHWPRMTTTRVVEADGLGAKTHQLDVRSTAWVEVEVEVVRARWAGMVNKTLEHAQMAERVDHRSYARQGLDIEPTVKMSHASAAIERRPNGSRSRPARSRTSHAGR